MKIFLAKTAGFCMGVRRAVEMVLEAPNEHAQPIFTFGPLIHNPQVLRLLEEKGITVLKEIPDHGSGTVLIRAHGVPPQAKEELERAGFSVIDATCPRVIRVQTIIKKHAGKGFASIIIGDRDHPEVTGLLGYAKGKGYVVDSHKDLDSLPSFDQAIIVAQTTQNTFLFEKVKSWATHNYPHYKVFSTICDSTERRQIEVRRFADSVDAIVVVGGHTSGNTRRLVEIAKETGKPAYHVEKESDLDEALTKCQSVGITAGASTPNWVLKRIYRAIESLPITRGKSWRRFLFTLQRNLLLTSTYVALGAGSLSYACAKLQGVQHYFSHILISILYIQSMHILNNLTGRKADRYNEPDRASFYEDHKIFLIFLAVVSEGLGLIVAYTMGLITFFILLIMSILGLSYNLRLFPVSFTSGRYKGIRDIPGSKTVLIAVAWGIVTAIFPALSVSNYIDFGAVLVFLWITGMVFVRTAFFDILDMQGDQIVGKETIPIILGEKKTMRLLKLMLIISFIILLLSNILHLTTNLGFVFLAYPVILFIVFSSHEQGYMLPGIRLEFLVDTHFVLSGILSFAWSMATGL